MTVGQVVENKFTWLSANVEVKGVVQDGGFEAQLGEHASIWLDYYFE